MAVVNQNVPSFSVTFDDRQYQYILETKDEEQSKSDRVRKIVNKGIESEKNE